jgi:hypothetical protein
MIIAASLKIGVRQRLQPDGSGGNILNVYDNAGKLFNLVGRSIRTTTVSRTWPKRFRQFMFDEQYATSFARWPQQPILGFMVVGYSSDGQFGEEFMVSTPANGGPCTSIERVRGCELVGSARSHQPSRRRRLTTAQRGDEEQSRSTRRRGPRGHRRDKGSADSRGHGATSDAHPGRD